MQKTLSAEDIKLQNEAVKFIKDNKKLLINKFVNLEIHTSRKEPITIFMAGMPGAGKTEVSKGLVDELKTKPVRIDADEIRELFSGIGYNGKNSYIFQQACSHGVDKLFDYVQHKKLHAIVDGTFASNNSIKNVERAIGRDRKIFIYFIYQDPTIAWKVAKGRELEEGRHIPRDAFIDAYYKSQKNVNEVKEKFKNDIKLNIIIRDIERNGEKRYEDINNIDQYIKNIYTKDTLIKELL